MNEIGFCGLFILIFSAVGSGPCGIEGIVGSCGITLAVILVVAFPFFWGFVQALVAAELSVKYSRENGGACYWCAQLFGSALARNATAWLVLMMCSTSAFVTEVTVTYFEAYWPGVFADYWKRFGLGLAIIAAASLCVALLEVKHVGFVMWAFSINSIAAFVALVAVSASHGLDVKRLENPARAYRTVNWAECLNLLIYNSAGYDSAASVVKHVRNPRVNVPLAMVAVAFVIAVLYVLALLLPYMASDDSRGEWQSGHFVVVARVLGGEWLAAWITAACALSNLQVYTSSLLTASNTLRSMCSLSKRDATLACALLSVGFVFVPLLVNLSIESVLYVFIMAAELACFLRDDGDGALVVGDLGWRRALTLPPLALCAWVLVVQQRAVAAPVIGAAAVVALFTIQRREKALPVAEKQDVFGGKMKL